MKKIFSIIFIGVLFFQFVYIILPTPHAKAATAATDSIENQALSYQAFVYLTDDGAFTCGSVFAGSGNIPKEDGPKLLWFMARTEETRSGSILDPSGQADCNQGVGGWLEKALQIWGYGSDYTAFLTDVGFTNDGRQYNKPNNLLDNAKKVIRQKYYGTTSTSAPQLTDALKYRIYYENFANGCQITETFGPTLPSGYVKSDVINEIKVIDSAGGVKSTFVQTEKGRGDGIVIGYNVGAPQQGFEADCGWLADQLKDNSLVNAYAAYIKSHPTDTTAPTSDASGKAISPSSGSGNILSGSDDHCLDWSPLSWLMCPIIGMADGLYNMFINFMQDILNININDFENNEGLKASWAVMRNIASSALVLVALIMIAGQIFNFEFMSAYTVKKILPRLVIAAIAIQLSWFIFTTVIVIINAIGVGIYSLMLIPFQSALGTNATEISTIYSVQSNGGQVFTGALAALGAAGVAIDAGGLAGVVAVAIAGAVAIGAALVTLILRKVLIIGLLILAPLALVAWVLPGTQKYWTSWWNLFIKLLLMFPLIMVLIASGKIAASIIGQQENTISPIIALVVYFLPLFLIPATFKFAGGIFATTSAKISGMSGKWGQGLAKPWRERAQLNKDNSRWALSRKSRMADRQSAAQRRYSETLNGTGTRGWLTRRRSGASADGRIRAQAAAAGVITAANEQTYKDRASLAEFQVRQLVDADVQRNRIRYHMGEGAITTNAAGQRVDARGRRVDQHDRLIDRQGQAMEMSRYDREVDYRSRLLTHQDDTFSENGVSIALTNNFRDDVAIQGLKQKDGSAGIQSYINDAGNFARLKDYGTENSAAWQILAEKLPTAAKGAPTASLSDVTTRGFPDALKGFAGLAQPQQEQVIEGLAAHTSRDPNAVATMLNDLARNIPGVDQNHFAEVQRIFNGHGLRLNLGDLRSNPNATIRFDQSTGQYTIS